MPHIHHDLASVFQVVPLALQLRQHRACQVERNADDRLSGGASPFIGEITKGAKLVNALGFEFAIELLHELFNRRPLEFEPEFLYGPAEDVLKVRLGLL